PGRLRLDHARGGRGLAERTGPAHQPLREGVTVLGKAGGAGSEGGSGAEGETDAVGEATQVDLVAFAQVGFVDPVAVDVGAVLGVQVAKHQRPARLAELAMAPRYQRVINLVIAIRVASEQEGKAVNDNVLGVAHHAAVNKFDSHGHPPPGWGRFMKDWRRANHVPEK